MYLWSIPGQDRDIVSHLLRFGAVSPRFPTPSAHRKDSALVAADALGQAPLSYKSLCAPASPVYPSYVSSNSLFLPLCCYLTSPHRISYNNDTMGQAITALKSALTDPDAQSKADDILNAVTELAENKLELFYARIT